MTATVRLDESLDKKLTQLANTLHKKKSDVIREAISFYASNVENSKKNRILSAVEKTMSADLSESKLFEGTLDDGL